ncbi:translocation/assembly module TamB domain-containing protein [Roseivivax sp. CAU 1761]
MKRILRTATVAAALAAPLPLNAQDDDRGYLERLIEDNLSSEGAQVDISGFRGALSSEATLENLTISDADGVWLEVTNAVLDWNRTALLRGRVSVDELSAEKIVLARLPGSAAEEEVTVPEAAAEPFTLPELPVSVRIGRIAAERVELGETVIGQEAVLSLEGSASLEGGAADVDIAVRRLDAAEGQIDIEARYSNEDRVLALNLLLDEAPGGLAAALIGLPGDPSVRLAVQGEGPLADFTADLQLATDGEDRLTGAVRIADFSDEGGTGTAFGAEIEGDVRPLLTPENREFFGPSLSLDLAGRRYASGALELETLDIQSEAIALTGALELGPDQWPVRVALEGRIAAEGGGPVALPLPGQQTLLDRAVLDIGYDAEEGDSWRAEIAIDGLERPDLSADTLRLDGSGSLTRGGGSAVGGATGGVELAAEGLAFADPRLADAVGQTLAAAFDFGWTEGEPLAITALDLDGAGVTADGAVTVSGIANDLNLVIAPDLAVTAEDIARFSALAGRDLAGRIDIDLDGSLEPLSGAFDLQVAGNGRGLQTGIAELDGLLAGAVDVAIDAVRNEAGLMLRNLDLSSPTLEARAEARIGQTDSDGRFDIALEDIRPVLPELSGRVALQGTLTGQRGEDGDEYTIDTTGQGPGGARIDAEITARLVENALRVLRGEGRVAVDTLATYAPLAGRDLAGAVDLEGSGSYNFETGDIVADVTGSSTDLAVGIDEVDALLEGQARLRIDGEKREGGVTLRQFSLQAPRASITADGQLLEEGSDARFDVQLRDLADVVPTMSGTAALRGSASQDGTDWRFDVIGDAPGGTEIALEGVAEIVDWAFKGAQAKGRVAVETLEPFAGLVDRPLAGSLTLDGSGSFDAETLHFSADVTGESRDIVTGIDAADALLDGAASYRLDARRDAEGLVVDALRIDAPKLQVTGDGAYRDENGSARFDATITDLETIVPTMSGSASLRGRAEQDGETWDIDVTGSGPGGAEIAADVAAQVVDLAPQSVSGTARLAVESLAPYAGLAGRPLAGSVALEAEGRYTFETQFFDVELDGTSRDVETGIDAVDALLEGAARYRVEALRDADGITLRELDLATPRAEITAEGALRDSDSFAEFDARLTDLEAVVPTMTGSARLTGTARQDGEDWALAVTGSGPGGAEIAADVTARVVEFAPKAVEGTARVAVDSLAPYAGLVDRPLGGALALDATGRVDLETLHFSVVADGSSQDLRTGIEAADALLAGAGRYAVDASRDGEGIVIRTLDVETARASVEAEGVVREADSAARFDIALSDLGAVVPGMSGTARATGRAEQSGDSWAIDVSASGPGSASAEIDARAEVAGTEFRAIRGSGQVSVGSLAPYSGLAGMPLRGAVSLDGSGAYALAGKAFEADLQGRATGLGTGIDAVDRLLRGTATFAVDAAGRDGAIRIESARLDAPEISGEASGQLSGGSGELSYDLRLRDVGLFTPDLSGPASARGTAALSPERIAVDAAVTAPGGARADVSGSIARSFATANLRAAGAAPLGLANGFIEPNILTGEARFDLALNGPLALTSLSGNVVTRGAELIVPAQGLALEDIAAEIALGGSRAQIALTGNVGSGGQVALRGPVALAAPFEGDLAIDLRQVIVAKPGLYETIANGELRLTGPLASTALLAGRITLDETEIRVPSAGPANTRLTFDVTHVNVPPDVAATRRRAGFENPEPGPEAAPGESGGLNWRLNVDISSPAQIFVRGRGLDAELGGDLGLRGTLQDVVPVGRFDLIRGRLDILGQRLELSEAYIQLQGDFDPFIRVRADTQRGDTTVTIIIEGPVSEPEVTFASNPARSEEEVLSLLLFGRDLSEISGLQALRIAAALNTLAGRGGVGVLERLRMSTGLDDFDVQTAEDGTTELRLGKYISERAYTDVTVNGEGETEINLNLTVTPSVTARGTVGTDGNTGVGIFFERDY